jgi:DNA-directed RNA polymerase subunit N (RpoN/RPB10)
MLFVDERVDLNAYAFNEYSKYYVLLKFGLERWCTRHFISQTWMLFVDERANLNACAFNEYSKYHVLLKFGLERGCTRHFISQIHDC